MSDLINVRSVEPYYAALGPAHDVERGHGSYSYTKYYWPTPHVVAIQNQYEAWLTDLTAKVSEGETLAKAKKSLAGRYPKFVLKRTIAAEIVDPSIKTRRLEAVAKSEAERVEREQRCQAELARCEQMGDLNLTAYALKCMHALNRAAKSLPYGRDQIYALKKGLLEALVLAEQATVGKYQISRTTGYYHYCDCAEYDEPARETGWYSRHENSTCHRCGEGSCGSQATSTETWYLIRCGPALGGYGFHQPGAGCGKLTPSASLLEAYDAVANPIEAHDPTNPNREVPDLGIDTGTQIKIVEMLARRLAATNRGAS